MTGNPVANETVDATHLRATLVQEVDAEMDVWVTANNDIDVVFSENGGSRYPVIANRPTYFMLNPGSSLVAAYVSSAAAVSAVWWPNQHARLARTQDSAATPPGPLAACVR